MAAQKTTSQQGGTAYTVLDAHGNKTVIQPSNVKGAISMGPVAGTQTHLTQQNVSDLLATLTNFAATGVLT